MSYFEICMLIVGFLTIATCILYARTKKFNGRNNLPVVVPCGVISMIITTLGILHPSWWMLCIACYGLMILFIWAELSEPNKYCRNHRYKKWYRSRSYQFTTDILGWFILASEFMIPIIILTANGWLEALPFLPILAISGARISNEINTWLKKF